MAEVNSANSVTGTDSYGNKYTQSVSNDSLTTNDFLKLMIEELKLQDPTKPMDSSKMLSTQMQMSTLNANMEMIKALQSIQTAFNNLHFQQQLELLVKMLKMVQLIVMESKKLYN